MFGFNIPTWEFLDVLAVQWEYFGSKFPNNSENLSEHSIPVPKIEKPNQWQNTYNPDDYTHDDWKWSVYGKKHIYKGIDFFFQFGVDHLRFLQENFRHSYASISQESTPIWEFKPAYFMTRFEFGI